MRRNLLIGGSLAAAGLVAAGLAAAWLLVLAPLRAQATVGTGYAAKFVCSCLFVSGLDEDQCRADLGPGLDAVTIAVDPVARSVKANTSVVAAATANHDAVYGCTLK